VEHAHNAELVVHLDRERAGEECRHRHNIGSGKWPSQCHRRPDFIHHQLSAEATQKNVVALRNDCAERRFVGIFFGSEMSRLPYPGGSTSPGTGFWITIQLRRSGREFSAPMRARVDTDSTYTWIPRDWLDAIGVMPDDEIPFEHSDGRQATYPAGWIQIRLAAREQQCLVVFAPAGSEPVVGSLTLACFGLAADPPHEALIPVPGRL